MTTSIKLQRLSSRIATATATRINALHHRPSQVVPKPKLKSEEFMSKLLDRRWALLNPASPIHQITPTGVQRKHFVNDTHPCLGHDMNMIVDKQCSSFFVLRDDLLHPLVNGNKARKLDALLPLIEDHSVTDVVTCGGCQSAHTAAVAVSCAERGLKSHLLLRGEKPEILTGYNLVSSMFGNVTYVPRSIYAERENMLKNHADLVAGEDACVLWCNDVAVPSLLSQTSENSNSLEVDSSPDSPNFQRKVMIVNEGAGDAVALLGVVRLVSHLSQDHLLGTKRSFKFVVDAGTGTTAIGLALGAKFLGLPWEITAVMLADKTDGYKKQEKRLISDFKRQFIPPLDNHGLNDVDGDLVCWVARQRPRKFGKVFEGEIETCQEIAKQTGILFDPIYTLAAWETATHLSNKQTEAGDAKVVMLHTGGTLGMFGLAQRYKTYFH